MAKSHTSKIAPKKTGVEDQLQGKWGTELIKAGWTAVPNILLEKQHALALDSLDLNILLFVMKFWWDPTRRPFASKRLMAEAMRVAPRTIQRRITALEGAGYIKGITRRRESGAQAANGFDFAGLIRAARPFAANSSRCEARAELRTTREGRA